MAKPFEDPGSTRWIDLGRSHLERPKLSSFFQNYCRAPLFRNPVYRLGATNPTNCSECPESADGVEKLFAATANL